jgi:hypothetical protein
VHYKTLNTRLVLSLLIINPPKPTLGPRCTFTSPPAEVPALQDTKGKRLGSLLAKDKELQDLHLHPSTKQPELLPNTDRVPSTQQPIYETAKGSSSSGFFVSGQKAQNIDKNACR